MCIPRYDSTYQRRDAVSSAEAGVPSGAGLLVGSFCLLPEGWVSLGPPSGSPSANKSLGDHQEANDYVHSTALIFTVSFPGSLANNHLHAVTYQVKLKCRSQKECFSFGCVLWFGTVFPPELTCWRLGLLGGGVEAVRPLRSEALGR